MFKSHFRTCVVLGSLLTSSAAIAGTTGTVNFGGSVTSTLSVSNNDSNPALDLTTASVQTAKVSALTMSTNNETGLKLTATSGNLTKAGGTNAIAFQVSSLPAGDTGTPTFATASGSDYTVANTSAGSFNRDLYIQYTPSSTQASGAYTGSIGLTVTDNA